MTTVRTTVHGGLQMQASTMQLLSRWLSWLQPYALICVIGQWPDIQIDIVNRISCVTQLLESGVRMKKLVTQLVN